MRRPCDGDRGMGGAGEMTREADRAGKKTNGMAGPRCQ